MSEIEYEKDLIICTNCKSFDEIPNSEAGRCKFNAPLVLPLGFYKEADSSAYLAQWPIVHCVDFCGQFKSRFEEEIEDSFIDKFMRIFRGE